MAALSPAYQWELRQNSRQRGGCASWQAAFVAHFRNNLFSTALVAALVWSASSAAAQPVPIRRSQEFTAVDGRSVFSRSPGQLKTAVGVNLVRLDADVLLLSAERIRETLWWELALSNSGA